MKTQNKFYLVFYVKTPFKRQTRKRQGVLQKYSIHYTYISETEDRPRPDSQKKYPPMLNVGVELNCDHVTAANVCLP